MRAARITRNNQDAEKLMDWLSQNNPFPQIQELISISTGLSGNESIDCHMARERGVDVLSRITDDDFYSVKLKRADKVNPLGLMNSSIRVKNDIVPINPLLIFQRMCIAKKSEEELQEFLTYELAPFPLSLFNEEGMRKCEKSALYKSFEQCPSGINFGNTLNVIDGGYLLHRVTWRRGETFSSICDGYVEFVQSHYGPNAIVVFDGYPENALDRSTKFAERCRRAQKHNSTAVIFDEKMIPTLPQEKFLSNDRNKTRFIDLLKVKFSAVHVTVEQAYEDADTLIINTAITMSPKFDSVKIIGEDVDLLILLTARASSSNIYLLKPGRGKILQQLYNVDSMKDKEVAENILFLHAFTGCDTTSAFFKQGKTRSLKALKKNPQLRNLLQIFKDSHANPESIADAGERFILDLYGYTGKEVMSLNQYRHHCFMKSAFKSKFTIASLPPTEASARQHSFRAYHQIQHWYGVEKKPEEWGWQRSNEGLIPVTTLQPPAPDNLLKLISCKCKKGCRGACGCRKAGLKCSIICFNCNGICDNVQEIIEDVATDETIATTFQPTPEDYD